VLLLLISIIIIIINQLLCTVVIYIVVVVAIAYCYTARPAAINAAHTEQAAAAVGAHDVAHTPVYTTTRTRDASRYRDIEQPPYT